MPARSAHLGSLAGAALGVLFFLSVYGAAVLDPRHIGWLLHGDPAQHYLGFAFFRDAPWGFPLGRIPQFGEPGGTSLVYTDSIPLLALLFKPFASWLPADFQYFGLWMALSYVLYGLFAARILARLELRGLAAGLGVLLLLTSPALALRAYGHESLMAHWLLLAAFDAHLSGRPRWHWPLLVLASLIHAYWVALLAPFALLAWWRARLPWRHHAAGAAVLVLAMAVAGYFVARPGQLAAEGYGYYSANLLTFFDPMDWRAFLAHYGRPVEGAGEWSRLLPALGQATWGQYEGFAYLGAGVLLLLAAAAFVALGPVGAQLRWAIAQRSCAPTQRLLPLAAIAILMFLYALSLRVTVGERVLTDPALPAGLESVLGIFRATGRFAWPLAILLPVLALAVLARRLPGRWLIGLLLAAIALQAYDLSGKWAEFSRRFALGGIGGLPDLAAPGWQAAGCYPRLVVLPAQPAGEDWIAPALAAARHGQAINLAYVARADAQAARAAELAERRALLAAAPRVDTAYLVRDAVLLAALPSELAAHAERLAAPSGQFILPRPSPCSAR